MVGGHAACVAGCDLLAWLAVIVFTQSYNITTTKPALNQNPGVMVIEVPMTVMRKGSTM